MATKSMSKRQKRQQKKNKDKKVRLEMEKQLRDVEIKQEATKRIQEQQVLKKQHSQEALRQSVLGEGPNTKIAINYIADRNGCGYFRCIWPFELLATYKNIMGINSFMYHFEQSLLSKVDILRFQRQATSSQLQAWETYRKMKAQLGYQYKLQYEIDDLLMEIEPHNKVAYDYFDQEKKDNHMRMLHTADSITFSTDALKDIYVNDYNVDPEKIRVVKNFLPQFLYSLPYRNAVKEFNTTDRKPRVFWSGSASHVGEGGDLQFLVPLIERTVDKYQWVFQGTIPPSLVDYVKEGKIEFLSWVPVYGLANIQFYKARPDVCLAPLNPTKFNSCKSDLKYLESCALGAPCITTSFEDHGLKSPYDAAGSEICIEPDADLWEATIDHLVGNPDYYMDVSKNQYNFLNGRWMEANLDQWVNSMS